MSRRKVHRTQTPITPTEIILESISDGVFTVDQEWRITSFNRAAEQTTGIPRKEAIGRRCCDVFRSSMCETDCALRKTLETGKPIIGKSGYVINAEGERIPISLFTAVLRDARGRVIGGAETFRDLGELEALRQELKGKFHVGDLVSRSPLMQRVFDVLPAIAASPSTVLILGETGARHRDRSVWVAGARKSAARMHDRRVWGVPLPLHTPLLFRKSVTTASESPPDDPTRRS